MLAIAEITQLASALTAKVPLLTGIKITTEYDEALTLLEKLLDHYDENLFIIEALSNVIARYEDERSQFDAFNERQIGIDPALASLKVLMDQNK